VAEVGGNVFEEVETYHLPTVRPVAPAVDGTRVCACLHQRVEVVGFYGVIVAGEQHAEVRPIMHGGVQQRMADATQAYSWSRL
jgi:hypothetical protein